VRLQVKKQGGRGNTYSVVTIKVYIRPKFIRSVDFTATECSEVFSGYQLCENGVLGMVRMFMTCHIFIQASIFILN
jgi:hypothetical protein